MKINFFEEFPTRENLEKAALITWEGSLVFLAAGSVEEFKGCKYLLREFNPTVEAGWWPVLEGSYWISPWADPEELFRITRGIKDYRGKLKVLIDLEPPLLSLSLFLKNLPYFKSNKRMIRKILEAGLRENIEIYTAELPAGSNFQESLLWKFGLRYPQIDGIYRRILMLYSSAPFLRQLAGKIKAYIAGSNRQTAIGLGAIVPGVRSRYRFIDRYFLGNESQLSPEELESDLRWCEKAGFTEVFIFRLAGLGQRYLEVLRRFV